MNSSVNPSRPASGTEFDWTAPVGSYASPLAATSIPDAAEGGTRKRGLLTGMRARLAALVAAGAIVGGGIALAVDHSSGSSASSASGAGTGTGTAQGGTGFAPASGSGGAGGITPTAYRLSGTVTAISGSSVTIQTSSGTKTYTVTSSTHLQRNGSTVSLSSFQVGDSVVGSTTTSGGSLLNDLLAGMRGTPAGSAPDAGSGSGSGASTSDGSTT
jgi:hypothetical protein